MKSVFNDLAEWMCSRQDHYYYEDHNGQMYFDDVAMRQEIIAFSDAFERQIQ